MVVPDGPAKPSEEELAQQRKQEISGLQDELAQLIDQIERMQLDIKKFTSNMQQVHIAIVIIIVDRILMIKVKRNNSHNGGRVW